MWPLTRYFPSEEAHIEHGVFMPALMVPSMWPVAAVHIIRVPSIEALQISWPLGRKEQARTSPECPQKVRRHCPEVVDHSFIVRSYEPLAIVVPSGAKEQELTTYIAMPSECALLLISRGVVEGGGKSRS